MNRRGFLRASAGVAALGVGGRVALALEAEMASATLPPWQPGVLDIHHIHTGRGNSTFVLMPDGTSLLIDAGAAATPGPAMDAPRPDGSRRPGEWIARYAARQLKAAGQTESATGLDYAVMTHFHGDHVGDVLPNSPPLVAGGYRPAGISEVAQALPIRRLIDRGYPAYDFPAPVMEATATNYFAFARAAAGAGTVVEKAKVGSAEQIRLLRDRERYPEFDVRIIAGNGAVWAGNGEGSTMKFPPMAGLERSQLPSENSCSLALRMSYGKFSYFTGGDLNCDTNYGRDPWRDVETPAARVAGPVSVATCNHHGYFDATGPEFVGALRPRVWILQAWHAAHASIGVLANLYSPILYPGERDVFCTGLHLATALASGRFSDQFKSSQGHVVVRVAAGGAKYSVHVLEDGDESGRVKGSFGPYLS
jgi:beta-lactamase superfamily II metal-dependent hydrolase